VATVHLVTVDTGHRLWVRHFTSNPDQLSPDDWTWA